MENHVSLNPGARQDDKNFILKMKKKSGLSGDPDTSKPCRPLTYEKSTERQLPVEEGINGFKRSSVFARNSISKYRFFFFTTGFFFKLKLKLNKQDLLIVCNRIKREL